ncbi:peptidoglycan DD-metalloendopeptidase family protein [Luethyella okanaganae]|uniref:Peptidoglycan DD-metalloendopeptidase family protein n=1 Tax=Luethyella okanaganae TaxID=69372 RepID=A0ABW1VIW3_9MICO
MKRTESGPTQKTTRVPRSIRRARTIVRGGARSLRRRFRVLVATGAIVGMALTGALAAPASATDYPSWQDLQNAKANTAAGAAAVENIKNLIAQLQTQVVEAQAESDRRSNELIVAREKFDEANDRANALQTQADTSQAQADTATKQAGQLAAQLYRTGGGDLSVNLFLDGRKSDGGADQLLSKLGSMSKLVERSSGIYEQAQAAQNTARALSAQAEVAKVEREKLRLAAEEALAQAVAAQAALETALAESQARSIELDQQLRFLQDQEAKTSEAYQAGVAERARLEAERIAREQAERGGGPGAGLPGGWISDQGWAVPASGNITDGYGPRQVYCSSGGCSSGFHRGTDIGTGCSAPIYAAASGTVVYSGRNGTYGNWIEIDHGGGVSTGYAHIRDGGRFVGVGDRVDVGQNIASSGTTGASTGCHLHFEVRINGGAINPVPFMADRGAPLG